MVENANLGNLLWEFQQSDFLCDIILHAGDMSIKAHRIVLSSRSLYFYSLFRNQSVLQKDDNIHEHILDIPSEFLLRCLKYIYTEEVENGPDVSDSDLELFHLAARKLEITKLCMLLEAVISNRKEEHLFVNKENKNQENEFILELAEALSDKSYANSDSASIYPVSPKPNNSIDDKLKNNDASSPLALPTPEKSDDNDCSRKLLSRRRLKYLKRKQGRKTSIEKCKSKLGKEKETTSIKIKPTSKRIKGKKDNDNIINKLDNNGEEAQRFECEKCGMMYNEDKLEEHLKADCFPKPNVSKDDLIEMMKGFIEAKNLEINDVSKPNNDNTEDKCFEKSDFYQLYGQSQSKRKGEPCLICNQSFKSKLILLDHLHKVHSLVDLEKFPPIKCQTDGCIFLTYSRAFLNVHIRAAHSSRATCELCGRTYRNEFSLKAHQHKKHMEETFLSNPDKRCEPVTCNVCDETFADKVLLRRHHFKVHETPFNYECKDCDYASIYKRTFILHRITNHNDPIPPKLKIHKCPYCNVIKGSKSVLAEHISRHTGKGQFQCAECGKVYHGRHGLRDHLAAHKAEKNFQCQHCSFRTHTSGNLKQHIRIKHTGDNKPHMCDMCGYRTKVRGNLYIHLRNVHNLKVKPRTTKVQKVDSRGNPIDEIVEETTNFTDVSQPLVVPGTQGPAPGLPSYETLNQDFVAAVKSEQRLKVQKNEIVSNSEIAHFRLGRKQRKLSQSEALQYNAGAVMNNPGTVDVSNQMNMQISNVSDAMTSLQSMNMNNEPDLQQSLAMQAHALAQQFHNFQSIGNTQLTSARPMLTSSHDGTMQNFIGMNIQFPLQHQVPDGTDSFGN